MFHGRISLNLLILLLANFVSVFRFQMMYISLIVSIRSSLTHPHGFQLLALLQKLIEITFFICTNRKNLLILKKSVEKLVIAAKVFLKLPNLNMLLKQNSSLLPRKLTLRTFGELLIVFSTKA